MNRIKLLKWIVHPISIFIVAQVSWGLLMVVWIRWYVLRSQEIDDLLEKIPIKVNLGTGQWIILAEGCLLMAIILVGLYMIFVSFRKQVKLNKLQDSFLSSVTHELKTPLASIRLYSETMLLRSLTEEDRAKFLHRTLGEADRLQRLIDSILISARIESQKGGKRREVTNVLEVLSASYCRVKERYDDRRQFSFCKEFFETEEDTFIIHCDPLDLSILFDNLLDNAVKYTQEQGKVDLFASILPHAIHIKVVDDGMGIEGGHLKRVFQKFYRVERNLRKKVHGSGLGLYVCYSIVEAHGGKIYATSDGVGKGATIHVEFQRDLSAD
jgi:signal transduction histidine kinase